MISKSLLTTLTVTSMLIGILGGFVGATWALEDRIEAKISARLEPFEDAVHEIRVDIRDIKQFLYSVATPEWRR